MTTLALTPKAASRFWAKVDKSSDCWAWTGYCTPAGYGRIGVATERGRVMKRAHRLSYEMTHGPIAQGLQVDHKCHNRRCVNPAHLRTVTNKQNQENLRGTSLTNASGVRGVTWHKKTKKWSARVVNNGRVIFSQYFATIADAEAAVVAVRNEVFTHNDADRIAV